MRVIVLGPEVPAALAAALSEQGVELQPAPMPGPQGDGATAELAGGMRAAEAALEGADASCALITATGDAALAAALTAVKLGIPSAWLAAGGEGEDAALTARVADLTVDATGDAAAGARAIASLAASTISAP